MLQCQSGNKKAAAILVKRWHNKLCKQAYWYVQNSEVAKDIAQDSWNIILLKITTLKDSNSFGSWALTIVTRKAVDWLRKNKKELENLQAYRYALSQESMVDGIQEDGRIIKLLHQAIRTLPSEQQMMLQLYYKEGYSVLQISKIVCVSPGTVKSRLFTAG